MLDDVFADILGQGKPAPDPKPERPREWANVASTYVKPVRGGMQAAPVVRHAMKAVRDPECERQFPTRCKHRIPCQPTYVAKCRDAESCAEECGPVNVDAFYHGRVNPVTGFREGGREGTRAKGGPTPAPKRIARGEMRGDRLRAFQGTSSVAARMWQDEQRRKEMRPLSERPKYSPTQWVRLDS